MGSAQFEQDEIVSFPVPKRYLPVVIRALADAMKAGSTPLPPTPPDVPKLPSMDANKGWTKEQIIKLKKVLQNKAVRVLLDMTAQRPDQWIGFREFMKAAQRTYGQARGDLAGFTQLLKREFGRDEWPVQVEWSDDEGQVRYLMSPDVAGWWVEA